MTQDAFAVQMDRLSGLRFRPASLETHWEALRGIPEPVLEAAVTLAQRTRSEFPTPVELRQDADQVAHHARALEPDEDRSVALAEPFTITVPHVGKVVAITREWNYYCEDCSDSGWQSVWCGAATTESGAPMPGLKPWYARLHCERRNNHDAHEYVRKCVCFDSNPALVRKRQAQEKFAEKPADKRG